jgi:hypothetical protein
MVSASLRKLRVSIESTDMIFFSAVVGSSSFGDSAMKRRVVEL